VAPVYSREERTRARKGRGASGEPRCRSPSRGRLRHRFEWKRSPAVGSARFSVVARNGAPSNTRTHFHGTHETDERRQ
jgi:hypothetical protein